MSAGAALYLAGLPFGLIAGALATDEEDGLERGVMVAAVAAIWPALVVGALVLATIWTVVRLATRVAPSKRGHP